jgi:uncharacterized protein
MKNLKATILFLIFPVCLNAQKNVEERTSIDLIRSGIAKHDDEKFDDAIQLYSQVSLNDTNFTLAQYEIALSYFELGDYKNAQTTLEELIDLNLPYKYKNELYGLLGSAYDEDDQKDKSIEMYSKGIELFPKNYSLFYNRALVYQKMEKHHEAIADLKSAIICNAGHSSSHFRLGVYAANEGHYVEAAMCFMTYLMIDPSSERANHVLGLLDNISSGSYEEEAKGFEWNEIDDFEQQNIFFKNKVALEKDYKVKLSIDMPHGRQLHMMISTLKYDKNNEGFWNQIYIPFLKDVLDQGQFDNMILFSLQTAGSDKIQKKLAAKKSKISAFLKIANPLWVKHTSNKFLEFEGKKQFVKVEYGSNGIDAMGKVDSEGSPRGAWYFYYPSGSLKMIAHFDENGEATKQWEIKNEKNGNLSSILTFNKGNKEGETTLYYLSGELQEKKTFKKDILEDTLYSYFRSGDLLEKYAIKNGFRDGEIVGYHENGQVSYKFSYIEGVANGLYVSFHPNGQISKTFTLKDDKLEGMYTTYYASGVKSSEVKYVNDLREGDYIAWYRNGQMSEKTPYVTGKQTGEFFEYFSNGKISYSGVVDNTGKQNGTIVNFGLDGKKYLERDFKKGELVEVRCFNKAGEVIYKNAKKGKKLDYKQYYADGGIQSEGLYENDMRSGKWKFYDRYGNLSASESYENGMLSDTAYGYYPNGQVKYVKYYEFDELNGIYLEYNIFGVLTREGLFKNDEYEREWYIYNYDGSLSSEHYYIEGEEHGVQKTYNVRGELDSWKEAEYGKIILQNFMDSTGKVVDEYKEFHGKVTLKDPGNSYVEYEATYKNGKSDGVSTWYLPNGNISTIGSFVNHERSGEWKYFYDNGKLSAIYNYVDGELEGEVLSYYYDGELKGKTNYIYGERAGIDYDYYKNGQVSVESNFLDGERHGKTTYYDEDGKIYMIRYYDMGIFKSYSYLGKDGKEVTPIELKPGSNLIVTYYQNGQKAVEHTRKNGLIEGHYLQYYSNGQLDEDNLYKFGDLDGETITYYKDGKVETKVTYEKDNINGTYLEYHPNGKLKFSISYLKGELNGQFKEYDVNGKLIKSKLYYCDDLIKSETY